MSTTPAGWYDDGSGRMRWWDGEQWTEHFRTDHPPTHTSSDDVAEARRAQKQAKADAKNADKAAKVEAKAAKEDERGVYKLGFGNGTLRENRKNGTVSYFPSMAMLPVFTVTVSDVRGFSSRKATKTDLAQLAQKNQTAGLSQLLEIHGLGSVLARAVVNYATPAKIEAWFRSRPDFVGTTTQSVQAVEAAPVASGADEVLKLAELHKQGILSDEEFAAAKARALGL